MTVWHSRHGYILVGRETTYGTAVSAVKDIGLVQNVTPTGNMNWTRAYGIGDTTAVQSLDLGRADFSGSLECILQHGRLLDYITGTTVVHDATSTPDIKHTFAEASSIPSFTMEEVYNATTDITLKYHGVKLSSLTLALALDGYLRCRADWTAEDLDPSGTTATTAVISTLTPFKDFMGNLSWGTIGAESAQAVIQSMEFTINRAGGGEPRIWGVESKLPQAHEVSQTAIDFRFSN